MMKIVIKIKNEKKERSYFSFIKVNNDEYQANKYSVFKN